MKRLIVLRPDKGGSNPYIDIIKKCIEQEWGDVITPRMTLLPQYVFRRIYISNFNWYENVDKKNKFGTYLTIFKRKLMIVYLKIIRKSKIVITIHNKKNHNAWDYLYSEKMLAWMIDKSDKVIVLCDETIGYIDGLMKKYGSLFDCNKVQKIPMPNYVNEYIHSKENELYKISGVRDDNWFEIVYFGTISRYKNVEILSELAKRLEGMRIHITIAGEGEKSFCSELEKVFSKRKNVSFVQKFIPDECIWGVIKGADCIILPYKKETVLNSSAVMLSLSVGTNVICPSNGTTNEFPKGLAYTYEYKDEHEHLGKLFNKVNEAYADYMNNREYFNMRIKMLNSIVINDYSYDEIRLGYKKMYYELEKTF